MSEKMTYKELLSCIDTKKPGDHDWFLSLLDEEEQRIYEDKHMDAVMQMLRILRIRPHKNAIKEAKKEIARLEREEQDQAGTYKTIKGLLLEIQSLF